MGVLRIIDIVTLEKLRNHLPVCRYHGFKLPAISTHFNQVNNRYNYANFYDTEDDDDDDDDEEEVPETALIRRI